MSHDIRSYHTILHPDASGKALHVLGELVVDGSMTINNIKVGDALDDNNTWGSWVIAEDY